MASNRTMTISNIFAVIMAIIITSSMALTFTIIYLLMRFGFSPLAGALTSSSFIALLSITLGTIISSYVSKKILRPVFTVNDAARKVAMGDFTVRLEEKSIAREIQEISTSFNVMVRELSHTETLQNDFVSNVSHEFKTPLAAIEGYATLMQDETLTPEETRQYIASILMNSQKLTRLTQNILALSRIENQEIVLQKEWFQLDEQIRQIFLLYETRWEEKNLSIDLNLAQIRFYHNPSLLAQVWSNLLDNAIKFSSQNGELHVDCDHDAGDVVVKIRDTGIGMDPEIQKRAFDKFYQGESSHHGQGNGLGLALVKRIVTLCGGSVTIGSQKGVGTLVTVVLRPEPAPGAGTIAVSPSRSSGTGNAHRV